VWDKFATAGTSVAGDDFAERHRALKQARDLQFDFPEYQAPPTPAWLASLGEFVSAVLQALGPLLQVVLWGGVALLVAMLLYFAFREAERRWGLRGARREPAIETPVIAPEAARRLLADADALAAEGRYAEAIHVLLHRSIAEFDKTKVAEIRDSLTSREIARLPGLPNAARTAFATIAAAVEASFFGGRDVDAKAFGTCRLAYASFALPDAVS
jgi:hypothetical protein